MRSSLVAVAVAALLSASSALTLRNKHVGDFRLFSEPGCHQGNLGVWTVIDDDITGNRCQKIADAHVHSVFVTDVNNGCTLYLYEGEDCKAGKTDTTQGHCHNSSPGWKAWSMTC